MAVTPVLTLHNQLPVPFAYHFRTSQPPPASPDPGRGELPAGGAVELFHLSPDVAVYLSVRLPGFRPSSLPLPTSAGGGAGAGGGGDRRRSELLARVQPDRRAVGSEAELHREVVCRDETKEVSRWLQLFYISSRIVLLEMYIQLVAKG